MKFLDRTDELEDLARIWDAPGPQVYVLFGRRRVGKSSLLRHFLAGRRAVVFQAAEVASRDNLEALMIRAAEDLGRPELARLAPTDIEAALEAVSAVRADPGEPIGIVLDEFPNLLAADGGTASLVQRFCDSRGPEDRVRLFLCGSAVRVMEAEVLGQRSPLYGRRTGQQKLRPLPFDTWRPFCPEMPVRDRLWLHAATGGIPAYLTHVEGFASARAALGRLFFERTAILAPEADFLLRTELSVVHTYASILRAVAGGSTRMQEIAERVGTDGKTVSRYLPTLIEIGYVARETSLDDPTPEKSRKGRYRIADALMRFHFRFVQPYREVIDRGDGLDLFDQRVKAAMPTFCGPVYEDVLRERLARRSKQLFGSPALRVGRLYGPWGEIDVAIELLDGSWVLAECKATGRPIARDVLDGLRGKISGVSGLAGRETHLVLGSMSGFSRGLLADSAGALLIQED